MASAVSMVIRTVAAAVPVRGSEHVLVAIDGVDGAGKSMFAASLAGCLRHSGRSVIEASVDGFHHHQSRRYRLGRWSPQGFWLDSYDYSALRSHLIAPLQPGGSGKFRLACHDVATDAPVSTPRQSAAPGSVLVLDGLFLHRSELRDLWHFSIYLDVPVSISLPRLAVRDGSNPDPAASSNIRYVEAQKIYALDSSPRSRASMVIDNSDFDNPVVT